VNKKTDASTSIVGQLIDKLTPLRNEFADAAPLRKVEILWEIGDHLVRSGVNSAHNTGWKVQERSYISRDMLTKGYQVRGRWSSIDHLHRDLPRLKDYSSFRDLFPYVVGTLRPDAKMEAHLLASVRDAPSCEARALLQGLKGAHVVPRKRDASKEEKSAIQAMDVFLAAVDEFLFRTEPDLVCGSRRMLGDGQVDWFSRACLALAGAVQASDVGSIERDDLPAPWRDFAGKIPFMLAGTRGSRFRSSLDKKRLATVASQLQWSKSLSGLQQLRMTRPGE